MQTVVGVLGGIAAVLLFFSGFAELGISLSGLNPFLRRRRKQWRNQHNANPIYNIESPMEMAALLMIAVAKGGNMSPEVKLEILKLFEDEFQLSKKDASALLIASVYLLRDGSELRGNLKRILQKSLSNFTQEQAGSTLSMIGHVASLDKTGNGVKNELVAKIKEHLLN